MCKRLPLNKVNNMKYNILILILLLCYCKVSHAQLTKPGVIETTKPKTTTAKSKPPIPKPKNNWTKKYDYVVFTLKICGNIKIKMVSFDLFLS